MADNRGKYHRFSIFEEKPEHLYNFSVKSFSKKTVNLVLICFKKKVIFFLGNNKEKEPQSIKVEPEEWP